MQDLRPPLLHPRKRGEFWVPPGGLSARLKILALAPRGLSLPSPRNVGVKGQPHCWKVKGVGGGVLSLLRFVIL